MDRRIEPVTGARATPGECVHHPFERQVERTPDTVAVVSGTVELTYRELEERANQLAHALLLRGAGPEARVGICVDRSAELIVGLLGILKAGAAYVPLDPAYPRERISATLRDARASLLVAQDRFRPLLDGHAGTAVWLDADREELARGSTARPPCRAAAANVAYLIYTSGSTGTPKGVVIEHRSALALLEWCREAWPAEECGGVLGSTSVSFDMSVFEVFHTLGVGGTLVLAENALALARLPARERVTLVNTVPSAAAELLRSGAIPPSVRVVNLGGEPLPNALGQGLYALGHVDKVWNLYGPTEDTTYSTAHRVARGAETEPPVGRAVPGTRVYLLDTELDPVADGEVGEVYLAGDGLTRGYLDRPGLTAERFFPDALGSVPGARMYRVGDRGRILPCGELEYLGRVDHQVKIRGFRVELGEVETVLRTCPGVGEAAVVAREDGSGDRRLVAYVTGGDGTPAPAAPAMRKHLEERLPGYMVPAAWVALEKLPLLPNGKLDRGALPEPDLAGGTGYAAPRTPTEERLAGIWAEVLGVERAGVHDGFFELGGHSLRAAQVITRVRAAFGVELPMTALFDAPTIAELAERVGAGGESPELPPLAPVSRDPRRALPVSLSQEAIWFFQKLAPGMQSYNFQAAIRFRGSLDVEALERTFTEIVRRHEVFRTTFPEVDGRPAQVIHPPAPVPLPCSDLRDLAPAEEDEEVARQMREEFGGAFDLARLPLVRWRLLRLAADEHLLLQVEHHFVHDGWSFGVFLRELAAIYPAFARGEVSPLPELPIQFADFAVWHREVMRGERARADLAYWKEKLAGADPTLDLPTDRPRPPAMSFRGSALRTRVPPRVALAARAHTRRSGATLYMTLLAGFEALLQRYSGQEDFCVGGAVANRSWKETEPLIGMIVNTVAFRAQLGGARSFRELAERVRDTTREGYAHKDVHFGQVVEALQPERSLSRLPVYQVAFGSHDSPYPDFRLPGVTLEVEEALSNGSAKFELSVVVMPRAEMRPGAPDDEIEAVWEFSTDLFEAGTVERMVRHYHALLEAVLADPEAGFREVPLLEAAERGQVLEWGGGGAGEAADASLHALVAAQARRTPDAAAVVHGDGVLTYAGLEARAGALAGELRARGVGPEVPVGVCLERGADAVVALLAVLGAGGVYVPLDPANPADRLAFMLADSGARLVLTAAPFAARLPDPACEILLVGGPRTAAAPPAAAPHPLSPDNLAYVIYTSGSTGTPKGVMVTHGSAVRVLRAAVETFGARPGDRVAHTASLSFDASILEVFLALLSGAALHVADRETVLSADALGALLREREVGSWVSTPALLELLADGDFPALRCVSTGGERCPGELAARWSRGRRLVNMYGPTETTVYATRHLCRPGAAEAPPIGRPETGAGAYVLDAALQPAPVGVPGELYVGGAGVARGYRGRAGLTAGRFVPDGVSGEAGARLYRTGDRARWRADGELEFLGRADDQVKIRGLRVEPGEVEAALRAHPGVRAAAVAVREDAPGRRVLVAYAVAEQGVTGAELREAARRRVPEYMVPAAVVLLDALPLTPTGKLDRRALPAPARAADASHVAPRTPTEEVVAGIWAEVLGLERVGVHDDFFELGGHSLVATRVAARLRPAFGVDVPLRALFEAPSVARLSALVDAERSGGAALALPPLVPVSREGPLPLSFAQQRLWFIHRMDPGSGAYNVPLALRLRGALDARVLERTVGEIVRRHEALRTVFEEHGGEPVQVVRPAGALPLPMVDLSGLPGGAREAHARALVRRETLRPFDLRRGPLLRARLLRLSAEEHVLVLAMHHVVTDGWSVGVLLREAAALYGAFARGASSPLPEPPVQYADYAVWQRGWLAGETLERQLAWWRERLAGAPPVLEIPVDRPRPPVPGERGASLARTLPRDGAERLRALARGEGATLFMVLLSALDVLLCRWSGQDDVVVGTPVANRGRVETEGLIGFLVNTLALRTELAGSPAFSALLGRVREGLLGAYQHQEVPFEKLVEELGVERSLSHAPLFQVVFTLDQGAAAPRPLGEVEAAGFETSGEPVKFDLRFALVERGAGLEVALTWREELWEASTMERVLDGYLLLLEGVVADPGRRVLDLPLLRDAERERLLAASGGPRLSAAGGVCVHDLVAAQAARTPGAPALAHAGGTLTYAELERGANRLAHHLRRHGVGPEIRVGVCLRRDPGLVVALLAVLRAGGAYVPLDPAYPRERLRAMLEDADVALVLTTRELAGVLPEGAPVLALEDARAASGAGDDAAPESGVLPENLSHVIFTSGSTGRPKGVMIRHASVVVLLHWLRDSVTDEERSAVLFSTSVSFDVSVAEVFGTLAWGGKLVLVEDALALATCREPVVYASMVPSAAAELLRMGAIPASVRTLNLGGEPLPADLARALYATGTVDRVGNLYGPTEDTTYSTCSLVARGVDRVTVGRPVANTRALVLDGELRPVPAGVVGELYLAGDGLSRGYARRPDLTAERFLPDPFGPAGSRMYRVLDRVRWTAGGELEYFGRTDFQVKVRGFRIELEEIETVLRLHPGVREAVAVVREDAPGDRRIVAYLVPEPEGPAPAPAEVRARLGERLPEYMLPSALVVLRELPRTPGGKLDRRALPAPGPVGQEGDAAPRTPVEEVVAGIWAEVLGLERVGVHDDFFELGGHSLLATRVVARVGDAFGVELPLRALFEASSVARLSALVGAERGGGETLALPPLVPVSREGPLPLSFAQQRLWFIHRMDPGSGAYNVPLALRLRGPLEAGVLERTVAGIVRRHEALRTVFEEHGGEPVQVVRPAGALPLPMVDLSGLPEGAREAHARHVVRGETLRPFDLRRGPLLRARLLRLSPEEHVLVLCMHHVVADGWSVGVLLREAAALYGALARGEASPLPELPVQYADYAVWQRAWLAGETLERELAWWRERLAGAPPVLEIPVDRPRRPVPGERGASLARTLPREGAERLRALARGEGATLFMVLLAALDVLLCRWSGQDDVVVGTPVANRTRVETEGLVGFFVNTLALRVDASGNPSFRELLGRVRETALGAYQHQDVPFEKLVEELGVERSLSHAPLFQVVFTLDQGAAAPRPLGEVEAASFGAAAETVKFDLAVAVVERGGGLEVALAWREELWEASTMARAADAYALLLEEVAADPGLRVLEIPLTTAAERERMLRGWSAGPAAPAPAGLLHEVFAAQAARIPGAPAVVHGDQVLTYAGLDARAARLARRLRGRGVGPEVRVGLFLEPSPDQVVAVLAVLRAGGAYVPIDPSHPADRVAFVLEDADVRVLLTTDALRASLPTLAGGTLDVVCLDGVRTGDPAGDHPLEGEVAGAPEPGDGWGPQSLAYVIYTSGSTGRPKGVLVEHGSLAGTVLAAAGAFGFREGDVFPVLASYAFDIWAFEVFVPLAVGGTARLLPRERVRDVGALAREAAGADALHAVPALMREVAGEVLRRGEPLRRAARVFVGGDAVPPDLLAEMRRAFPAAETWVLYGPTEGTVICAAHRAGERTRRQMLGAPLPGESLYVLDAAGSPLPAGLPGELCIGGGGVARGYLGRPELTAGRFVPDPFSARAGARLYRTGDRARWGADGELEFLGRVDGQVKIRGFRIEPGEIEAVLLAHPGVREAVVVVRGDALAGDRRLAAYVVPARDGAPTPAALREHLKERLPEYMVPPSIVPLGALPLTPTGKLDRRALPAPESTGEGYTPPRTPVEEMVAGIWAEVLGLDTVGVHDDFFELGGHSLLATRVAARLQPALGVEVPLRALFEAPSVARLAALVDAERGGGETLTPPPLVPVSREGPLPLSFAQQRLWFIHRMDPGSGAYNVPLALRLRGALDARVLERTVAGIVRRHEVLRTVFQEHGGEPVQVVRPAGALPLPMVDLSGLPEGAREAHARRLVGDETRRPFDLGRGPLLRARLLRLSAEEHVLVLAMHHVVTDGWSMGVLLREMAALYGALSRGASSPLPELPVQYADYAAWQRGWLAGAALDAEVGWWKERLAGAPPLLEVATDHPRAVGQSDAAASHVFTLSADTSAGLRALARREGATLFMTVLAGWQALLGRWSGQDDVVVGTPIAGRTRAELEELIGFFVNMLPLRADLGGGATWRELLGRVREGALGAYSHQDLPFERLVEELAAERSLTHTPVFQATFALQEGASAPGAPALGEVALEAFGARPAGAQFDLDLTVVDEGRALRCALGYRGALFEAATIARMAGHLETLLAALAADPERRAASVSLLGAAERAQVLAAGRGEARPPEPGLVHDLIAARAAAAPELAAVACGERTLSYRELHREAGRLAARLRAAGVGVETPVAVFLDRSAELGVALLAVLRAGGAFVPVDPGYPRERVEYLLADSGAAVVVTRAGLAGALPEGGAAVLCVDEAPDAPEPAGVPEAVTVGPDALAYLIYTSGSTGRPKAAMVSHRSLVCYAEAMRGRMGLTPSDRVLQFASPSFDVMIEEVFPAWLSGACVVFPEADLLGSPRELARFLEARRVSVAELPTAFWHEWVRQTAEQGATLPASLRLVMMGGERVLAERLEQWAALDRPLLHVFGLTEATVTTTTLRLEAGEDGSRWSNLPVGTPLANAEVYVLDAEREPVPAGIPGELYVGGEAVARGYRGRPELTAERYVPHPFSPEPGARLYRTGDRVRMPAAGMLEFLGRIDQQVKVRGYRIEPAEVEAVLCAHPAVREAAVVVGEDARGDRALVAYVAAEAETAELREWLRARVPEYMVPGALVELERLPLTSNGKVDRRALPAPEWGAEAEHVAPRTATEEVLAGIWAEVLELERVGAHDNFFERGGHSLLATRVVARVAASLGAEVPLRALFEAQTLAELAARIDAARHAAGEAALPPLVAVDRSAPLPLSFAQERLWFLHQMDPQGAGYNMPFPSRVAGPLDVRALEQALGGLVRRHESLRTTFRAVDRGAVQVVHPAAPARIPLADLSGLAPEAREREARRLAEEDAERPFDLRHGPLLRLALLRLRDDEHVMLLCIHHVVGDGWSMGVFFRELYALYGAASRGEAAGLPSPTVQYGDFAVWQRGWLAGGVLRRQLDWWRERLAGAPPALELPVDHPRPPVASGRGASLLFRVPAGDTRALRGVARREGATLYMVVRAAADVLLARWSGQEDLVVGSPIAGRTRVELEGLIGFFVNTLALRTDLAGDPTFGELVGRVRETALGAYAHQDLPFERLVEEVAPERSLSHTALFQVMFALQNVQGDDVPAPPGLRIEPFRAPMRTARFDLELDLFEEGEELVGSLRFRTDLFDRATVERFAAQYRTLLASAGASPAERCSRLRLLPAEETRALLAYGSGPAHAAPAGVSVPRLLAEQAARTPGAAAVLSGDEALTYGQLDRAAARLARLLRGRGVRAGTTVAVCVERGPQLLVALLAVWKAGGVYLPLDPGHPAERLAFLLGDSGARLVLSEPGVAGSLPEHPADRVLLGSAPDGDADEPGAEPSRAPEEPAYLIYTSGSTGTPKAVVVEHAQLAHTLLASLPVLGLGAGDVVAALASVAFDISLLEMLAPLLAGCAVRIVPREAARDPAELVRACADATVLHAVPALMRQVVEAARGGGLPAVRLLLVGGDTVPPDLLEEVREVFPRAAARVLYGPTEATIICAAYEVPARGGIVGHPLGHPLPGVRLRVRGPRGEVLPLGVPGEVWISGGSVARGYLGRPELTAERFVTRAGERAYRTGDRARWRTDGVLEFLGRTDEQVKVRGFRIEPGEVEAALRGQPGVREAVVLAREDQPGEKRLVAYVVPESADRAARGDGAAEQVSGWATVFDETYGAGASEGDPALDLTGWNSSYTGEPIPREEMREWVEQTVERILALRPRRVLEIGCGTGLLLFRLAPHVREYHGTDFSAVALERVRRHLAALPHVKLAQREADDLAGYAGGGYDTVVINSVAQYFPGVDYLLRVLEGAAAALGPGGRIFVGDVRSLPLLAAFHASVELARAPEELPLGRLRERLRRAMAEEQELVVEPAFFEALRTRLPRLGRVEVQVKRGGYDNEVSRFRYDVVLHLDSAPPAGARPAVRSWSGEDAAGVRALLAESTGALLLRGVPDPRTWEHVRAAELLSGPAAATAGEVRARAAADVAGIPREALGDAPGRAVEVRPGAPGTLDVLLHPAGGCAAFPAEQAEERPWESYANDPQWGRRIRALAPALRDALRARLPEYMLPSALVVLESLPTTPNGKVDRQALPAPDTAGASGGAYAAPRSALEEALAGIWQEVLGVERVGIHDSFFDLGGHSLLATHLVARIRVLRVEVPVRQVFQTPTVAGLAESITRTEATPGATEMIARVLLRLKTMSPAERAAALRAKQTTVGA